MNSNHDEWQQRALRPHPALQPLASPGVPAQCGCGSTDLLWLFEKMKKQPAICSTSYEKHISKGRDDETRCPVCKVAVAWHLKEQGGQELNGKEETTSMEQEVQKVIDSAVIIKIKNKTGNGVAVSEKKAVTAVHGVFQVGQVVQMIDIHGRAKNGIISFMKYETSKVDIAVVELTGSDIFDHFIPFHSQPVKIDKSLRVISLSDDGTGEFTERIQRTAVEKVIRNTAIIHTTYSSTEGMSGGGIVTIPEGSHFSVVGIHVGSHKETKSLPEEGKEDDKPKAKKQKTLKHRENYHKDQMSIDSNIHGHGAYWLICEIARVEGLVDHLNA